MVSVCLGSAERGVFLYICRPCFDTGRRDDVNVDDDNDGCLFSEALGDFVWDVAW